MSGAWEFEVNFFFLCRGFDRGLPKSAHLQRSIALTSRIRTRRMTPLHPTSVNRMTCAIYAKNDINRHVQAPTEGCLNVSAYALTSPASIGEALQIVFRRLMPKDRRVGRIRIIHSTHSEPCILKLIMQEKNTQNSIVVLVYAGYGRASLPTDSGQNGIRITSSRSSPLENAIAGPTIVFYGTNNVSTPSFKGISPCPMRQVRYRVGTRSHRGSRCHPGASDRLDGHRKRPPCLPAQLRS